MKLPGKKKKVSKKKTLESASASLQLANHYQTLGLVFVLVVVIGLGYVLFLGPKLSDLQDKSENFLPNKKQILTDLIKIENKLTLLERKFRAIQVQKNVQLHNLLDFLPTEPDYGSLFVQAEYLAQANDINLGSIDVARSLERPLSERRTPSEGQAQTATEQTLGNLPSNVRLVTINLNLGSASYENFKQYLDDLERNLRLYDVQTLSFESVNPETGKIGGFSLNLKAYYQVAQTDE